MAEMDGLGWDGEIGGMGDISDDGGEGEIANVFEEVIRFNGMRLESGGLWEVTGLRLGWRLRGEVKMRRRCWRRWGGRGEGVRVR